MAVMVCALADDEPVFQATSAATDRAPGVTPQPVAIHLGGDVHDAPVDRIALTGQLRQLLEQHLRGAHRATFPRRNWDMPSRP